VGPSCSVRFTPSSRPLLPSSFNQEQTTHAHTRITTESGSRSRRFSSRLATTKLDLTRPLHLFSLIIDRHFLRFHLLQNVKCSSFRPVNSAPIRQLKKRMARLGLPVGPPFGHPFPPNSYLFMATSYHYLSAAYLSRHSFLFRCHWS
jgi:hypothetical protein